MTPPPPANSKSKDATTTKLCTVIVRHISTKNQQLDFSNIIFLAREALISGEGQMENLEKMAKNRETYCYANWGVVNSSREYWPLLPGIKVFALLWFSCMLDQIIC